MASFKDVKRRHKRCVYEGVIVGIVRKGIYSKFIADNSTPLYLDLGGIRLYYSEAPEQPKLPYCVFHVFNEDYQFQFDLEFEEAYAQFDFFGTTADECDDGIADVKAMFDYTTLTLTGTGFTCLKMERDYTINPTKVMPHDIWVGIVRYTILIQKD